MKQLIGTKLNNRYQIQSLLGRQIGRRTFLATDLEVQLPVVVKLLLFGLDFTWEDFKLFEREEITLKSLDHPAVPKYLDYFELETELGKGFALIQTYIDAPSLEAAIQNGRKFSEVEVIELAEGLLDILIYIHGQIPPVIHRDIKPSNILLTNRSGNSIGDIYLVDFGSVQTVASKDSGTITIVGSYGYIPLEQFGGKTTMASDLYSLGMTLIYLITGVHPAELTQVNGQVKFDSSEISRKLSRWLKKMTHPHLDRRFDSAKSALTALKSEDGSHGDNLHLRPVGSKVELYRDRDRLEIVTLGTDESTGRACLIITMIYFIIAMTIVFLVIVLLNFGLAGFILSLVGGMFLPFFCLPPMLDRLDQFKCPDYKIISIDRNCNLRIGTCHDRSQPPQWQTQLSHFKDINLLAYNPGYEFDRYLDETGKKIRRGTVTVPPSLSIYAGNIEYKVGNNQLSQAELLWLGKELSDFLDLEMQTIYPTPRVPPEPQDCAGGC